jgi:hypothetical protein
MATATLEDPRKFRGKSLADRVLTIIVTFYPGRHTVKRLAADAEVSARTAENWRAGANLPNVEALLRLMAAHPELQDQINDEVALLRCAHASQQRARTSLNETNDRHGTGVHRAGDTAVLDMARKPGRAPVHAGVAHEGV